MRLGRNEYPIRTRLFRSECSRRAVSRLARQNDLQSPLKAFSVNFGRIFCTCLAPNFLNRERRGCTYMLLRGWIISESNMLSKEYLNTARVLLRVARNMADQAIADRLRALAEDYERKAGRALQIEKASTPLAADAARVGSAPR